MTVGISKYQSAIRALLSEISDSTWKCGNALRPTIAQRWEGTDEGSNRLIGALHEFAFFFLYNSRSIASRLYGTKFGYAIDDVLKPSVISAFVHTLASGSSEARLEEIKQGVLGVAKERYGEYAACSSYMLTLEQDPIVSINRTATTPRSRVNTLFLKIVTVGFDGRIVSDVYGIILEAITEATNRTNYGRLIAAVADTIGRDA